jgi:RNA polymerase sigma-70 factor, ECF subfamily
MSAPVAVALRDGSERERFEALYRECAADVYAYAASLLRDRAAAEDVTALTFERALRHRRRFDASRGSARAWLFGLARNAALDELRRRRRSAPLLVELSDEAPGAEADEDLADRHTAVRAGLQRLAPREREVILLKFLGRLSNGELARALGTSESNAGTRVHRALTRLREVCDAGR